LLGLAAVAGQAGLIVDQCQALAGQSVEHSGLADIRASDDGTVKDIFPFVKKISEPSGRR
jgi:hypothetical protein